MAQACYSKTFVAYLNQEIKPIVVSYPPNAVLDYSELETYVRTFLPRDQSYFILGESFSGPIAISIAASSPPGLMGVILCCSFAKNPIPFTRSFTIRPEQSSSSVPTISLLSYFLLGRFAVPPLRAALSRALDNVACVVLRARARAVLTVDNSGLLSSIRVPMLYLRAKEDLVVPQASSELVVSLAPHTQVREFSSPHFLMQVLPAQVADTVIEFMGIQTA